MHLVAHFFLDNPEKIETPIKETVTLSGTVIKLCGALHAFNIKRSSVEKIVQSFHVEKKIHADKSD